MVIFIESRMGRGEGASTQMHLINRQTLNWRGEAEGGGLFGAGKMF